MLFLIIRVSSTLIPSDHTLMLGSCKVWIFKSGIVYACVESAIFGLAKMAFSCCIKRKTRFLPVNVRFLWRLEGSMGQKKPLGCTSWTTLLKD